MHIQLDTIRIGHPHRDLGTADVDLLGLFVVQIQIRFDGVPVVTCSLMSKETGMGRETRRRTGLWGAPLRLLRYGVTSFIPGGRHQARVMFVPQSIVTIIVLIVLSSYRHVSELRLPHQQVYA